MKGFFLKALTVTFKRIVLVSGCEYEEVHMHIEKMICAKWYSGLRLMVIKQSGKKKTKEGKPTFIICQPFSAKADELRCYGRSSGSKPNLSPSRPYYTEQWHKR